MTDYSNKITRPDEGTKHVQRRIINRKTKRFICEVRMKPSGFAIRRASSGKWYTVQLTDLTTWMIDPKNSRTTITSS